MDKSKKCLLKGNRRNKNLETWCGKCGSKFTERGVTEQEVIKESDAGVTSLKALLRSLDFYPVNNGESVKDFK